MCLYIIEEEELWGALCSFSDLSCVSKARVEFIWCPLNHFDESDVDRGGRDCVEILVILVEEAVQYM